MIRAKLFNENYFYPAECEQDAENFFNSYSLETEIYCPDKKTFFSKEKRVCRFCSKNSTQVGFKKDAHIISELLGNHHLVSNFECDECNSTFGKYESDLANFLGITRTIQSVKGKKNKIPKFPSYDNNLKAESFLDPEIGQTVSIKRFDRLNKTFQFDKEKNQTIISYIKNPFIPLNVYKAILKMALSIIDAKYLKNYDFAFEYVRTNKHDDISGFEKIFQYTMPLTFEYTKPFGMIFKKKSLTENILTHVFILFALNKIIQINLPFSRTDIEIYKKEEKGEKIQLKVCPPIFGSDQWFSSENINLSLIRLNEREKVSNETESIIMPGTSEKIFFKNKETGEITEETFDITKVVGIEIVKVENPKV